MARHNDYGKWGEARASEFLIARGYAIRDYNWRVGHYDLDMVAMKGDRVIFVEVKTRLTPDFNPETDISRAKQSRLVSAADVYMRATGLPHEPQFDVIYVIGTPDSYTLEHIPDAFFPRLKKYS